MQVLSLDQTDLATLPQCIAQLPALAELRARDCSKLQVCFALFTILTVLQLKNKISANNQIITGSFMTPSAEDVLCVQRDESAIVDWKTDSRRRP